MHHGHSHGPGGHHHGHGGPHSNCGTLSTFVKDFVLSFIQIFTMFAPTIDNLTDWEPDTFLKISYNSVIIGAIFSTVVAIGTAGSHLLINRRNQEIEIFDWHLFTRTHEQIKVYGDFNTVNGRMENALNNQNPRLFFEHEEVLPPQVQFLKRLCQLSTGKIFFFICDVISHAAEMGTLNYIVEFLTQNSLSNRNQAGINLFFLILGTGSSIGDINTCLNQLLVDSMKSKNEEAKEKLLTSTV